MGFFKKLKRFFTRPVEVENNKKDRVIMHSKYSGKINLNKTLVVPEGYVCLLVAKEKVCDRFVAGEYKLSIDNIPVLCRTLKLNVPNKKGKYKNSFFADIYFVNLSSFTSNFESEQGVYIKRDKKFLGLTAFLKGNFSYKVSDPHLFVDALLKVYGIIKGNLAQRQVEVWTGELVDKKVKKNKPSVEELYERDSRCFDEVVDYLNKNTRDIGIEYTQVEVTETILPKNVYKKTKVEYTENKTSDETYNTNQIEEKSAPVKEDKKLEQAQPYFVNGEYTGNYSDDSNIEPKDNIDTNGIDYFDEKPSAESKFGYQESDFVQDTGNNHKTEQSSISFDSDIDNSLEGSYNLNQTDDIPQPQENLEEMQKKIAYKKCANCGAINPKSAVTCFECHNEFKKICQKCGAEIDSGDFVCPKCKSVVI